VIRGLRSAVSNSFRVVRGGLTYSRRGVTPDEAHQALINLFCLTGGRSNDALHALLRLSRPARPLADAHGVLGDLERPDLEAVTRALRSDGFYIFPKRLPLELCDALLEFALTTDCRVRPMDGAKAGPAIYRRYDREKPLATRYDVELETLINQPTVQALMADRSIISVAQAYLGCEPVFDLVAMWWHTAFASRPDSMAAQLFHFDMDRIKWLKFFIYLTDVDPATGPHTFVAGSHRQNGIPRELRRRGYERIPDADVAAHYPPERLKEFSGPRGTIIAEDTRGLHKGRHCERGDRLVLQFEFADSLFGATYKPARFRRIDDPGLKDLCARRKRIYANFLGAP
jgi:hypothetical protein